MTTFAETRTKKTASTKEKIPVSVGTNYETSDIVAVFKNRLDKAVNVGSGYRVALYNTLGAAYDLFVYFAALDDDSKSECVKVLKKRCIDEDITYSEKTQPEHAFIRLTFGDSKTQQNPHQVSQYARTLRLGLDKSIEPDEFAKWVQDEGGIVKLLNPNKRTTSQKAKDTKEERAELLKKGSAIKKKSIAYVAPEDVDLTGIEPVNKDTTTVAVVTRHKDGSFTLNGFAPESEELLETVYVEIGRAS